MGSVVRNAVLALVIEEPGNGYQVGARLVRRLDGVLSVDLNTAYRPLEALESAGLVEAMDESLLPPEERARRTRRQTGPRYRATAAGVEAWRAWLTSEIPANKAEREVLARLEFARGDVEAMLRILDGFEAAILRNAGRAPLRDANEDLVSVFVNSLGRMKLEATMRWIDDVRDELSALRDRRGS